MSNELYALDISYMICGALACVSVGCGYVKLLQESGCLPSNQQETLRSLKVKRLISSLALQHFTHTDLL